MAPQPPSDPQTAGAQDPNQSGSSSSASNAAAGSSGSTAPAAAGTADGTLPSSFENALAALSLTGRRGADRRGGEGRSGGGGGEAPVPRHAFWETQPVRQYHEREVLGSNLPPEGSIEPPGDVASVRKEPYALPSAYEWCTCDIDDPSEVKEVYTLLTNNYVEDDDNMFRFDYSEGFLRWALKPPGFFREWHIGVRAKTGTKKLVAFITGIPATVRVRDKHVRVAEINFLCVHKKLRAKRLAPVLIKEVTRRVHLCDIWHAVYTAGVVLPTPVSTAQYWHRSLNPKKLIDVGFSRLAPRMTMSRTIKLYKLPDAPLTPGIRPMERRDVPAVHRLLVAYLGQFTIAPEFTEADVEHTLLPIPDVIDAYVVEDPRSHELTDFISFYTLPSTIIGNANHSKLKAAYSFYNVSTATPLLALMNDALILARSKDYDVFNALDIMHNEGFLRALKFGPGDGFLHYYLYNYRVHGPLPPSQLGIVLL